MNFDVIVLGTGGVGSSAMFHLASQGLRVLGLDRFPPGHNRGSSHGESRVIRRSYFEHSDYVPLLNSAYDLWDQLSHQSDQPLLNRTGILYCGSPQGTVLQGIQQSAARHHLPLENLSSTEVGKRFPMFVPPRDTAAVFEADAGFLLVEDCVKAHLQQAVQRGAHHRCDETVISWSASDSGVIVQTDRHTWHAGGLVIAAGSWTSALLAELQIPLRVVRKHLHWYATQDQRYSASHGCPCYFMESQNGYFYGCPALSNDGLKVAEHSGGTEITDPLNDPTTPEELDTQRVETFLSQCVPGVSRQRTRHVRCFYTLTPDQHFVVDRHPSSSAVVFAAGLSGHGFKFTSVLGQLLAELVTGSTLSHDIRFLKLRSF